MLYIFSYLLSLNWQLFCLLPDAFSQWNIDCFCQAGWPGRSETVLSWFCSRARCSHGLCSSWWCPQGSRETNSKYWHPVTSSTSLNLYQIKSYTSCSSGEGRCSALFFFSPFLHFPLLFWLGRIDFWKSDQKGKYTFQSMNLFFKLIFCICSWMRETSPVLVICDSTMKFC